DQTSSESTMGLLLAEWQVRIALHEGRLSDAQSVCDKALQFAPSVGTANVFRSIEALDLRVRQLAGDRALRLLSVSALFEKATRFPRSEIADLQAAICADALHARGDVAEACQLLDSYLSRKRLPRAPPDP